MGSTGLLPLQRLRSCQKYHHHGSTGTGQTSQTTRASGTHHHPLFKDIYEIFHPLLCDLAHEEFWVLLLNQASRVIDKSRISRGGIDQTTADVRSILREALMQRATQIALIHNHPSGSPRPSTDDQCLTQLVQKGAQTMNIRLIDHVIVTDGVYYSFNDERMI